MGDILDRGDKNDEISTMLMHLSHALTVVKNSNRAKN